MAQLGFGLNVNESAYTSGYDQYKVSLLDALGAEAKTAWQFNPLQSTRTLSELATSRAEAREADQIPIPRDDLNKEYADMGLFFEEDEYQSVVDIMVQAKEEERARQSISQRGPQGFLPGVAKFGVGLGVSLADPINIASAFIPVVSQARMAKWVASQGFGKARLAKGVVEGAVGAAILEPLVLGAATEVQADYGVVDSFLNITFGSILGGGLHVGAGKLKDFAAERQFKADVKKGRELAGVDSDVDVEFNLYKKYYPEDGELMMNLKKTDPATRATLLKKSVNDLLSENPVDVIPVAKADPTLNKTKSIAETSTPTPKTAASLDNQQTQVALNDVEQNTVNKGEPEIDADIDTLQARLEVKRSEGPELRFDQDAQEVDVASKELDELETKSDELDFAIKDAINCANGR
tara:strand:+ start:1558 stop:2784 length:1227 start_codon:yes stop_codon:yes gene_type:complete